MPLIYFQPARLHAHSKNGRTAGFSLLELLTVICMVGILSTVALSWYGGNNRATIERVINQRNAQEIVSLGVCATMSGADFVVLSDKQSWESSVGKEPGKTKFSALPTCSPETCPAL